MINLLTPPIFDDEDKTLVAHHLFIIVWTFMAVGWLAILIAAIIPETVYRWLLVVGIIESAGLILLALNKYGHTRLASNLLIFIIWAVATGMALTGGGTSSNAMTLYLIIVFIAGLVLSGKAGVITAVFCSLTGLFLVYLEYSGTLPVNRVPHTPFTQWISNTIYMAIIISLQFLVSRTIRKALKQSRQELMERQRVDAALRESEERYRNLFENANEAIFVAQNGKLVFLNPMTTMMIGYSREEAVSKPFIEFIHPDDRDMVVGRHLRRIKGEELPQIYSFRIIHRDGNVQWVELNAVLINWEGKPATLNFLSDITERKQAEEDLRKSEERYRTILEDMDEGYFENDLAGNFTFVNDAECRDLGYSREELIGMNYRQYSDEATAKKLYELFHNIYNTGKPIKRFPGQFISKDGTRHFNEVSASLIRDAKGKPIGFRGVSQDITERKQVEEALRESEERYRALVESASDIVFRTDGTGHFTFVNPAGIRIMGYEEEEIIGRHYPTFIRQDMREGAMKFFGRQFVKGIPNTYSEYPVIVKDGREIWLGQNTQLIVEHGDVIGFQSVSRDITALKRVEEELRRNQDIAERLAQEMAIIAEIGKVVGSTLDTEEIYESFAAEVRKLIPFDRLSVNLLDIDQGIARPVYVSGEYITGRQPGDVFPLKGSVSEVLVRTRVGMFSHPLGVEEMEKRFLEYPHAIRAGMRSLLSVPLISRDEVIASLHFRSKKPNAYTEQDLRLAERIGEQIAGAIANAQLYAGRKKTEQELKESEQRYRDLSIIDDLTQLYNSRHFYFQLKIELDRSNRYGQPLTLLLLDLDNFKHFNDTYGHVEGDQVLRRLGRVVKRCLRETDFAYRYGGEEFTILLPMTTSAAGAVTAERIRTEFKKETFSPAPGQDVHVTVSIGLAQYMPQEEMKAFVHRVDQLMYQGKKNGKDRVCSEL